MLKAESANVRAELFSNIFASQFNKYFPKKTIKYPMITNAGLHKSRNNMTGNKKEAVRQFYEIPQTTLQLKFKISQAEFVY